MPNLAPTLPPNPWDQDRAGSYELADGTIIQVPYEQQVRCTEGLFQRWLKPRFADYALPPGALTLTLTLI